MTSAQQPARSQGPTQAAAAPVDSRPVQTPSKGLDRKISGTQMIGLALVGVAVIVIGLAIWIHGRRGEAGLTGLEQLLFGLVITGLTTVGTVVVAEHYYRLQGAREYQQLAQPALRRVLALHESVEAISDHISERMRRLEKEAEADPSRAVVQEWMAGAVAMLALHAGQLRASVIDWRQILPADFQELQDTLRLQSEYRLLRGQMLALEAETAKKIESVDIQGKQAREKETAALKSKLAKLEQDLAVRPSSFTYPLKLTPLNSFSGSLSINPTAGRIAFVEPKEGDAGQVQQ